MNEHSPHESHGHGEGAAAEHDDHDHGHGGIGKYLAVTIALVVLTAISFTAGSSPAIMGTPALGWTIMLAVSCCKALLVMLFFMHLLWEANWKYVLTIPASIMSIFLLLMLVPDVMERTRRYSEERWLRAPVYPPPGLVEELAEQAPPAQLPHGAAPRH
jgi:cytochrome c oxidase subunit 4